MTGEFPCASDCIHLMKSKHIQPVLEYLQENELEFDILSEESSYGYIFLQTIRDDIIAPSEEYNFTLPFKNSRQPILRYVYKVCFLGEHDTKYTYTVDSDDTFRKYLIGEDEIRNECEIHHALFRKRFNYGFNLVPPILTKEPYCIDFSDPFAESFRKFPTFVEGEKAAKAAGSVGIAILCMGFAKGYVPLQKLLQNEEYCENIHHFTTLARIAFLELLIQDRVIHGDAHLGNIMINVEFPNWLQDGAQGRPMIIDFGCTRYLTERETKRLVENTGNTFHPLNLLHLIRDGNQDIDPEKKGDASNADWLIKPACCSQCIDEGKDGIDEDELRDLYNSHTIHMRTIGKRIQKKFPDLSENSTVDNAIRMTKKKFQGGRKTTTKKAKSKRKRQSQNSLRN